MFLVLIIEGLLWLSEWFNANGHSGYTFLIAVASVGLAMFVIFLWFLAALVFRQRFQFGIRFLLLLTLVVAIPFSWLAVAREAARRQRELLEKIEKAGGVIAYDYELPPAVAVSSRPTPPRPLWLRMLLGDDLFRNVRRADLTRSEVSDAELHDLEGLTQLEELRLGDTAVSDAGLEHLNGMTRLQSLGLNGTKVSDVGLEHLKGLTRLRRLNLDGTNVTDAGLRHVKGLTQLRCLYLNRTQVSDVGLEHLKGLPQLQELFLSGTKVSDAGLEHLKGLTQLRGLFVWGTSVTDAGVEKLQQALPNCRIRAGASAGMPSTAQPVNTKP